MTDDFISVGKITGVFGYQGWLKVMVYSGIAERFNNIKIVYFRDQDDYTGRILEEYRIQGNKTLLKLRQVDDRETARELTNTEIYVPESQKIELPEDQFFIHDLIGVPVFNEEGKEIGKLVDVISAGANDVFVIASGNREVLVPAVSEFIRSVHLKNKRIVVRLWEEIE